jgi:cytidylate kinase
MKNIIGLTGPTGAGKSTFSAIAREKGFSVIDCDNISRQVTEKGSECLLKLAEVFGVIYELLTALGIPNEAILATVWKSGVGITGKQRTEQKKNAQKWVKEKYGFSVTEDEADAICIGAYASGYRAPKIEKVKKSKVEGFDWS